MSSLQTKRLSAFVAFLLWAFIVLSAFAVSIEIRRPYFGESAEFGSILQWTQQWYDEGPVALRFTLLDHFPAAEASTLASRYPYASYPPGTIVVPWLIAALSGTEPSLTLISQVGIASQLVLALLLSAIAATMARGFGWSPWAVLAVSLPPALLVLLSRGPLHYFMLMHVHDVAVLPWLGVFILAEVISGVRPARTRPGLAIVQQIAAFMAAYTDWFFFFVLAAVLLKRIALGEMKLAPWRRAVLSTAGFLSGTAAAMALYAYAVISLGQIERVLHRFLQRTDLSDGPAVSITRKFWEDALSWNFNPAGAVTVWITYAVLILFFCALAVRWRAVGSLQWLRPETRRLMAIVLIVALCPVVQIYVFSNHTYHHLWSGLKFSMVLALVTFSLGPILIIETAGDARLPALAIRGLAVALFIALFAAAWQYTKAAKETLTANFGPSTLNEQLIGSTIRRYSQPADIVISPDIEVLPKSLIYSFSHRVVHLSKDPSYALFAWRCLGARHNLLLVTAQVPASPWRDILKSAPPLTVAHGITLYRVPAKTVEEHGRRHAASHDEALCAPKGLTPAESRL